VPIAYLCSRYPAVSHTFVLREVEALRRRGVDVRTFSVRRADAGDVLSPADREAQRTTTAILPPRWGRLAAAHLAALARSPRAYLATLRRAAEMASPGFRGRLWQLFYFVEAIQLWHHCARAGISHIHAHFANPGSNVALLAADFGARAGRGPAAWSFTMHGPAEFYDVTANRLPEKVRAARFVACISDFCRSQLMGMVEYEHWQKLHVVHCGVDPAEFAPSEHAPAPAGPVRVLNVARLTERKGHHLLLEASARVRAEGVDLRVTIVGDGPERDNLARHARELGIDSAVELAGAVGQDRIRSFYDAADLFCVPSFAEGVPVVLMEAMAMELPVVATSVMGIPELVEDGVHGRLVQPGRADALADALRALAADAEVRAAMGRRGREKVLAEFDVHGSAARLEEIFAAAGAR
jgi:glycosyltransferase involved in cell wall biosynthesis